MCRITINREVCLMYTNKVSLVTKCHQSFLFTHKLSSIEYYIVRRQEFLACLFKIFEGSEIYVYIGWIGHYCDKT